MGRETSAERGPKGSERRRAMKERTKRASFESTTATVAFVDLAGFSAITDVFGDAAAIAVLAGEAHMLYASPAALLPHVRAKRLTGLAGAGPEIGGSSLPTSASTGSGTSGSVNTRAACASTVAARVVSRPGSPGPEPTKVMRPGLGFRPRVIVVAPTFDSTQFPRAGCSRAPLISSAAPSSNSSAATESPSSRARSEVPIPDARITSDPSSAATQPRSDSS